LIVSERAITLSSLSELDEDEDWSRKERMSWYFSAMLRYLREEERNEESKTTWPEGEITVMIHLIYNCWAPVGPASSAGAVHGAVFGYRTIQ